MNYILLFVPVIFSAAAQLLVKAAAKFEIKTPNWLLFIGFAMASYVIAFVLYSFAVRQFPISIASPVNTIAVMVVVIILAALLFGEVITLRQIVGVGFGLVAILLLITA